MAIFASPVSFFSYIFSLTICHGAKDSIAKEIQGQALQFEWYEHHPPVINHLPPFYRPFTSFSPLQ
jgi:hypothetical protein